MPNLASRPLPLVIYRNPGITGRGYEHLFFPFPSLPFSLFIQFLSLDPPHFQLGAGGHSEKREFLHNTKCERHLPSVQRGYGSIRTVNDNVRAGTGGPLVEYYDTISHADSIIIIVVSRAGEPTLDQGR